MAITKAFTPEPVPVELPPELRRYLDDMTNHIAQALNRNALYLPILTAPPQRPSDGMLVYADGVNWNPGSGAGFYGRVSGAWQKL